MRIIALALCVALLAGCGGEPEHKVVILQKPNSKDTARCDTDTPSKETYAEVEKCAKSFEDKGYERTESH
ncbi:MAG TPA: hypothetical protein VFT64_11340 [Rickettsiales bacterium]|nr:hypothetical protein [Rickettsiales bacterium]